MIAWILSGSPSSPLIFRIIKFVPFSLPVNTVFFKYGMEIIPVRSIITTSFLLFHCKLLKYSLYLHHKPPVQESLYTIPVHEASGVSHVSCIFISDLPVISGIHSFMALRLGGFLLPGASFTVFQDPCHSPLSIFAVSPLTGFLITKEPLHHFLRVISNYWLGTLEYILLLSSPST